MKRPIFFTSFFSTYWRGSKPLTSAAMVALKPVVSNRVIGPTPFCPASTFFHVCSVPIPRALTSPRLSRRPCASNFNPPSSAYAFDSTLRGLRTVGLDVFDGVLHRLDLFRVLVRDLDLELLLEGHHQLDDVQRIRSQVIDEMRRRRHFRLIHSELLHDDLLDVLFDRSHQSLLLDLSATNFNCGSGQRQRCPKGVSHKS